MQTQLHAGAPRLSVPLFYDHTLAGIFADYLLAMDRAAAWLAMPDAALGRELDRLRGWLFSDANGDREALEWLCGPVSRPPSVRAIRNTLRAAVPLPDIYWTSLARVKEEIEREAEEPFSEIDAVLDEPLDDDETW